MTWRDNCRPIIARVLAETAGQDEKAIRKALRDAYPYGEREPVFDLFLGRIAWADGDECWIWTGARKQPGYGYMRQTVDGRPHDIPAHRFAWLASRGAEPPADFCVCHQCDAPSCVRPSHLFLGTRGDNNRDRSVKGRSASGDAMREALLRGKGQSRGVGEANPNARLTEATAARIRARRAEGATYASLVAEFRVSSATIWRVLTMQAWTGNLTARQQEQLEMYEQAMRKRDG